jgi:hypothetical protein
MFADLAVEKDLEMLVADVPRCTLAAKIYTMGPSATKRVRDARKLKNIVPNYNELLPS